MGLWDFLIELAIMMDPPENDEDENEENDDEYE